MQSTLNSVCLFFCIFIRSGYYLLFSYQSDEFLWFVFPQIRVKNVLSILIIRLDFLTSDLDCFYTFLIFLIFFFFLKSQFCRYSLCTRGINPSFIKFVELIKIIIASITNEPSNLSRLIWHKIICCSSNSAVWAFLVCMWATFFQLMFQGGLNSYHLMALPSIMALGSSAYS